MASTLRFSSKGKNPKLNLSSKAAKIPTPRKSMPGADLFAKQATAPALKPLQTRIYTKETAETDPGQFFSFSFGRTGLEPF